MSESRKRTGQDADLVEQHNYYAGVKRPRTQCGDPHSDHSLRLISPGQSAPKSPCSLSSQPLSVNNLKKLDRLNAGMDSLIPWDPEKCERTSILSESSVGDSAESKENVADYPPKDVNFLGHRMAMHGLILEDHEAYDAHPMLKAKIGRIISAESARPPEEISEMRYKYVIRDTSDLNDATLLQNAWPIIMTDGCWVKNEEDEENPTFQDFRLDLSVVQTMNTEFRGTLLPHRYGDPNFETHMANELKKGNGIENPKPNYVLGINPRMLWTYRKPGRPFPIDMHQLLGLAPGVFLPFFLVEGKSDGGSERMAIVQARRAGSTLVIRDRLIAKVLNMDTERSAVDEGSSTTTTLQTLPAPHQPPLKDKITSREADLHSFVFSATMIPACFTVYVHWHEQVTYQSGATVSSYHMNPVFSQANRDPECPLWNIRRVVHNIIRWGSGERLASHLPYFKAMPDHSTEYHQEQQANQSPKERDEPSHDLLLEDDQGQSAREIMDNLDLQGDELEVADEAI